MARTFTVRVPLAIRHRGGRKLVVTPDGAEAPAQISSQAGRPDGTLVKALARAFRWRALLENGTFASIAEIAAAERINDSYVARMLRLTLLAPDIVESISTGRPPADMTLATLMQPFAVGWTEQRKSIFCWKNATSVKPSHSGWVEFTPRVRSSEPQALFAPDQYAFARAGLQPSR
jgi:hypothetical protein